MKPLAQKLGVALCVMTAYGYFVGPIFSGNSLRDANLIETSPLGTSVVLSLVAINDVRFGDVAESPKPTYLKEAGPKNKQKKTYEKEMKRSRNHGGQR